MRARYSPEDLIKIRQSPLVCKPASLPPTEEWMGPPQDQQSQNRRHNDNRNKGEGSFGNEGHTRPSILDTRHISRGSSSAVPSDIVLGPPKTAFASSGAIKSPRAFDSPALSAFGNFSSDSPRNEYFGRTKADGDKEGSRFSSRHNRDGDKWVSRRDQDESKGQLDRDSGEEQEHRGNRRQYQHGEWNNDGRKNGTRREGKPAWSKDDETFGTTQLTKEEKDMNIDSIRSRAWRDNNRAPRKTHEKEWDRQQHIERSPEWMATDEPEQKKERHTAQDIEAWKAQMKAQSRGEQTLEQPSHTRTDSGNLVTKSKPDKPLTFDKNMDSFFNLWDKPQTAPAEQSTANEDTVKAQQAKLGKASRFTGFFGPATPITPAAVAPPPKTAPLQSAPLTSMNAPLQTLPTAEESALRTYNNLFDENSGGNDDKAGFDRMLLMLRSSAPVVDIGIPQLPPNATKVKENASMAAPSSPTIHSPRSQKKHGLESILGQPQQPEPARGVINKDTEFLLNLLRKDEGWQQHFPGMNQQKNAGPPLNRPSEDHFFDERQHQDRHGVDKLNPNIGNMRPPQSRMFDNLHDEFAHGPPFNEPHGMPGPPGFDQHMPPSFPGMNRGGMNPPPGFANRNQAMFPPGLGPAMGNMNLGGPDRGPPPFMGSGPPGFMPNHGPPPPFPPQFPMMGPGHFPGPNGPMSGRPPLMDMFGPGTPRDDGHKNGGNSQQPPLNANIPPGFQRLE